MTGLAGYGRSNGESPELLQIAGVRFAYIGLDREGEIFTFQRNRRLARAARELRCLGVRRAIFPGELGSLFQREGIFPVSADRLRQELAVPLACRVLERQGRLMKSAVVVKAETMTAEVSRAVWYAAERCRYVSLDVPEGGEKLAEELRRTLGAALELHPARKRLDCADAWAELSPECRWGVREGDEKIRMNGVRIALPRALEERLPEGIDSEQAASVFWQGGALKIHEILGEIVG